MEIFIIGVIIVALMVYASTKIKRNAASAFEEETVETEEFSLVKPEGFLHVINDDKSAFAFYAYSKDFGTDDAEEMRRAEIFIKARADKSLAEVCRELKSSDKVVKTADADGGCTIELEKTVKEIPVAEIYKAVGNGKVYELKIAVLEDFRADYEERINNLLESFRVK